MSDTQSSYRQVLKTTSLFGGVQVVIILISIIRSKFVAVLLGPVGMGIAGLLNSTMNLITELSNAGLAKSAVKDISFALENQNEDKISEVISVLKRLVWITGIFGAILTLIFSRVLSQWAFETPAYTFAFIWLSLALLFKQLADGNLAILQGLRKHKVLASAHVMGSFLSLVLTVPLYYFIGVDAIAPAIVVTFLVIYLTSTYYQKRDDVKLVPISNKTALIKGKGMIKLGILMSVSSILNVLGLFLLQLFISQTGTLDQVGFYNAGIIIINTYVGMVFNAMSTDYYPRLAAIADKIQKIRETVFQQAYIGVLLLTPIIILFLMVADFVIPLLYSKEFYPVVTFVSWAILGMLFKVVSFSMGYIFVAKGDSKIFIKTALLFNFLLLTCNVVGFYLGGLEGLGISFLFYYALHLVLVGTITKLVYNFYFPKIFYFIFFVSLGLILLGFGATYLEQVIIRKVVLGILFIVSGILSLYYLNKQMDLMAIIKAFRKRF